MKAAVDTNILVRAAVGDDASQARLAAKILRDATTIAVSTAALCELVWVLRSVYKLDRPLCADAIQKLLGAANVVIDTPAVNFGLAILEAGGDFADGIIAHEGAWLGGETFVSFDKKAISLVARQGLKTQLLTA